MKPLQELSLLQRIALAIAIVAITVLVLIFISWLANGQADAQVKSGQDLYGDLPLNPALLQLDKRALDEAYEEQVRHLFRIWVGGQARSDKEISTGLDIARRAYSAAAAQIAKRER
jgi:hypothetical protein